MKYRISQVKVPIQHKRDDIVSAVAKAAKVAPADISCLEIARQSIDARDKSNIFYVYTVDFELSKEPKNLLKNKKISPVSPIKYVFPQAGSKPLSHPPVIVGSGPAGYFCGLFLARAGYKPIIIERGEAVEDRLSTVEDFWKTGRLKCESNVQFGEGGAGTFSDGKLNTMVKDKFGRNRAVLETFVEHGADESILYVNKPHIGTDRLTQIVASIRREIESLGGRVLFNTCMTDIEYEGDHIRGIRVSSSEDLIETQVLVLACGHSARDTFYMLRDKNVPMEAKSFAVGLRVMHPVDMINLAQYGETFACELPTASYKVTARTSSGRGVYSFCMCPGGYVVNASSEKGLLAVNGMSYADRGGSVSNSAIIVTVSPEDYGSSDVLSGVEFQRDLERKAYKLCDGLIPVQQYADFKSDCASESAGSFEPAIKGQYAYANLREIFTEEINESIIEGMEAFGGQIAGFSRPDALFAGVESRTSSPVRILRDETFQSTVRGLYPCGEGAGYAGGITSAAMDGIKVAEAIVKKYKSLSD